MEVRAFFLCEQIVKRLEGRLDVLGFGISRLNINAEKLPAQTAALHLLTRLFFSPLETGRKRKLEFALTDPDGKLLSGIEMEIELPGGQGSVEWQSHGPFPVNVEQSGPHAIVFLLDGSEITRWSLEIELRLPPSTET